MKRLLGVTFSIAVLAGACSPVREDLPTQLEPSDPLADGSLIPDAPLATPTPTPEVPALPTDPGGGSGSGTGDVNGGCGEPQPPRISRVAVGVLHSQPTQRVLNSSPLVGPDGAYCKAIGYTDGRLFCPLRPDGHPEREACEALQVGRATDTGRIGPTWTVNGRSCLGTPGAASCGPHPDTQVLALTYGAGIFRACVAGGICGEYVAP
jgi:hypothetical protein